MSLMERVLVLSGSKDERMDWDALCDAAGTHYLRDTPAARQYTVELVHVLSSAEAWSHHWRHRAYLRRRGEVERHRRAGRYGRLLAAYGEHQRAALVDVPAPEREVVTPLGILEGVELAEVPLVEVAARLERYYAQRVVETAKHSPLQRVSPELHGALVDRARALVGEDTAYYGCNTTHQRASRALQRLSVWADEDESWTALDRAILRRFIALTPRRLAS